jgi:hypothetical protein
MLRITPHDHRFSEIDEWPADVDLILSALEAADPRTGHQRKLRRRRFRVIARLSLFVAPLDEGPVRLFTRDADDRHVGFLSEAPVPLGFGGNVELVAPGGQLLSAGCMVYRCRECVPGWYEGVLNFNRKQPALARV